LTKSAKWVYIRDADKTIGQTPLGAAGIGYPPTATYRAAATSIPKRSFIMPKVELILGDCLEKMREIPDKSVDAVITDPPYGVKVDYGGYDDSFENWKRLIEGECYSL
jgi:hypothetical protein